MPTWKTDSHVQGAKYGDLRVRDKMLRKMIPKRRLAIVAVLCAVLGGGVLLGGAGGGQKEISLAASRSVRHRTDSKPRSARLLPARRRAIEWRAGLRRATLH